MNIFTRAWQNLPLSPIERAFLKFLYGAFWTAAFAGVLSAAQLISLGHVDSGPALLDVAVGGAWVTFGETLRKYFTAHADPILGTQQDWLNSDSPSPNDSLAGRIAATAATKASRPVTTEPPTQIRRPVTTPLPLDAT